MLLTAQQEGDYLLLEMGEMAAEALKCAALDECELTISEIQTL